MSTNKPILPDDLIRRKRSTESCCSDLLPASKCRVVSRQTIGPSLPAPLLQQKHAPESLCESSKANPTLTLIGSSLVGKDLIQLSKQSGPSRYSTEAATESDILAESKSKSSTNNNSQYPTSVIAKDRLNKVRPTTNDSPTLRRVLGPTPIPLSLGGHCLESGNPNEDLDDGNSSSSDDEYGPSLPQDDFSKSQSNLNTDNEVNEPSYHRDIIDSSGSVAKLKRAEWMLIPPTDSDWATRIDTTKLKSRKFASGKGATTKPGVSAIWTETPDEKRHRLKNEVLGRVESSLASSIIDEHHYKMSRDIKDEKESAATGRRILEYNNQNRNQSLLEERRAAQDRGEMEKEEEDDPSKRAFDREKDMALGAGQMDTVKRREYLIRAADFGNRFQKGKYL